MVHNGVVMFSHQRLTVSQHSIAFVAWSQSLLQSVEGAGSARTQLERASTSIPLNIAEGNVKSSARDRRRYREIALGSAVECAAILDVLVARDLRDAADIEAGKVTLERIVSMLIRLVQSIDAEGRSAEAGQRSRS